MTGSLFGFHVWVNLGSDPLNHERNLEAGVREEGEREDEHGKGLRNVLEHRRLRRFHMSLNPYRVTLSFKCSCIQFRICPISETGEHGCACTSARAHKSCDSCAWGSGVCARVVLESSKAAAVKSRNLT